MISLRRRDIVCQQAVELVRLRVPTSRVARWRRCHGLAALTERRFGRDGAPGGMPVNARCRWAYLDQIRRRSRRSCRHVAGGPVLFMGQDLTSLPEVELESRISRWRTSHYRCWRSKPVVLAGAYGRRRAAGPRATACNGGPRDRAGRASREPPSVSEVLLSDGRSVPIADRNAVAIDDQPARRAHPITGCCCPHSFGSIRLERYTVQNAKSRLPPSWPGCDANLARYRRAQSARAIGRPESFEHGSPGSDELKTALRLGAVVPGAPMRPPIRPMRPVIRLLVPTIVFADA